MKNNHGANITRYWPPAHCVRSKRDKWEKEYLFIQMQTFTDLLLKILRTLSCYFHQVQRRWKNINTQVWVEDNKVQFEHYRKPSANPLLMLEMSAMPANVKRSVLTQEVVTIMKNISPALPWSVTVKHLNHFSQRMQASGYDERYRFQIIKSGVAGYEKEESGGRPFNTPRSWEEDLRQKKKHIQKKSWFSKGGFHVPRKSFLEILFQIRLQNFLREYRCSI